MRSKSIPVTTGSVRLMSVNAVGFEVTDTKFPAGLKLESHYHDRACFSIIMEGGFDEGMGGKTYELLSASALCKPAGERHSDKFSGAGARVLVIEPAARQTDWLNPYANVLESVTHFKDQGVEWTARRIVRELETPDAVTQMAVDGLALELLARALRRQTGYAPTGEKRPPKWLARAQEYLHTSFTESLQIEDVAAAVGVHPVHLARVFRAHAGVSPAAYVRRLRLDWAGMQLSTSDNSLSTVAVEAGFADQSHFSRAFKRHSGLTPEQYRRATRR